MNHGPSECRRAADVKPALRGSGQRKQDVGWQGLEHEPHDPAIGVELFIGCGGHLCPSPQPWLTQELAAKLPHAGALQDGVMVTRVTSISAEGRLRSGNERPVEE